MKDQKELDNLINKIRLQVIEHTGFDISKRYQYHKKPPPGLHEARLIFLKVLESYYDIVANKNTLLFAKLLRMRRPSFCILLNNVKNDYKIPRNIDDTISIIKTNVESQIFLGTKPKTLKDQLIEYRNIYQTELIKINKLIDSL